jgi:hypothetical protein
MGNNKKNLNRDINNQSRNHLLRNQFQNASSHFYKNIKNDLFDIRDCLLARKQNSFANKNILARQNSNSRLNI